MDDNKITHKDPKVVSDVIDQINKHFGTLIVTRGKKFELIGMDIEIKNKRVHVSIKKQLKEAIEMHGSIGDHHPVILANKTLYNMSEDDKPSENMVLERFHSVVFTSV